MIPNLLPVVSFTYTYTHIHMYVYMYAAFLYLNVAKCFSQLKLKHALITKPKSRGLLQQKFISYSYSHRLTGSVCSISSLQIRQMKTQLLSWTCGCCGLEKRACRLTRSLSNFSLQVAHITIYTLTFHWPKQVT